MLGLRCVNIVCLHGEKPIWICGDGKNAHCGQQQSAKIPWTITKNIRTFVKIFVFYRAVVERDTWILTSSFSDCHSMHILHPSRNANVRRTLETPLRCFRSGSHRKILVKPLEFVNASFLIGNRSRSWVNTVSSNWVTLKQTWNPSRPTVFPFCGVRCPGFTTCV